MKWYVAAPFSDKEDDLWLGAFVPPGRHTFESVPAHYKHDRSRPSTNSSGWMDYLEHGLRARKKALAHTGAPTRGVITCFPQLPLVIGARQRLSLSRMPVVAWSFNLGHLPGGAKQALSRFAFKHVAKFVVHARAEVAACSEWLQLPPSRFEFVPLQGPVLDPTWDEDLEHPYVVALGSAGRDYKLLFSVLDELKYPAVVVAGPHSVAGLKVPGNVEVRSGLSAAQCDELLQRARLCVTPLANTVTASGQVTLINAMMYAKAQVVTLCPGSEDYLAHGEEALLVPPGDHAGMKDAVARLWDEAATRAAMGAKGRQRFIRELSDEAVGLRLGALLDTVEDDASLMK